MPRREGEKFPRADVAVQDVRRFLRQVLSEWRVEEHQDEAVLCLSELATNVLLHADGQDGFFEVEVALSADRLRVSVHDTADALPKMREPDGNDLGGRGLLLVDALADTWGVETKRPFGKVVWVEFEVESRSGAGVSSC